MRAAWHNDTDGTHDVGWSVHELRLKVHTRVFVVGVYVIAGGSGLRDELQRKQASLLAYEPAFGFDPAANDDEVATL